jgi:predicted nucleic acid-binding protein
MLQNDLKQKVLAKLISACGELEDALNVSVPTARYDPVVIPQALRNELSVMVNDLTRIVHQLEGIQ